MAILGREVKVYKEKDWTNSIHCLHALLGSLFSIALFSIWSFRKFPYQFETNRTEAFRKHWKYTLETDIFF